MVARLTDPDDLDAAPADGPVLLIGISNGGSMASRVAQHLPVAAVAIFVSNAVAFGNDGATIPPLVLCPGQNDPGNALSAVMAAAVCFLLQIRLLHTRLYL